MTQIPFPQFPLPPEQYDRRYFEQLVRSLDQINTILKNPGELRGTKITLTQLPTSAEGLEAGALYNDNGTVKIVS